MITKDLKIKINEQETLKMNLLSQKNELNTRIILLKDNVNDEYKINTNLMNDINE